MTLVVNFVALVIKKKKKLILDRVNMRGFSSDVVVVRVLLTLMLRKNKK